MREGPATAKLTKTFKGELYEPGKPGYETVHRIWNGAFDDRRPAVVARCADVADVAAAIRHAREHGLPLALRGGGHSLPGFSTNHGGVVIDMGLMKDIQIDANARTVRVGAGALWGEVDAATAKFGLATPGGQISHTGVAGLTVGGGIGWLMRKFGLVVDNLLEVELVTADGRVIRASEKENAELFWGVRGGGGNFGVVTTFTFRLHALERIIGGPTIFALDDAEAALRAWRAWTATLPDEMGTFAIFTTAPAAPFIPEAHRGRAVLAIVTCFVGSESDAMRTLEPFRRAAPAPLADLVGPMPYIALQTAQDAALPHGRKYYTKASHLGGLPDEAIVAAVRAAREMPVPGSELHIGLLGGAIARVPEDATAYPGRTLPYTLLVYSGWDDVDAETARKGWVRRSYAALETWSSGAYLNHLGEQDVARAAAVFGPAKHARLRALKRAYDPENVFRLNQNIEPAR